jgi:hypothetical protein
MSKVAQYSATVAGSAMLVAMVLAAVSGFSTETLFQPFFWICTAAISSLTGLAFGDGIGGSEQLMQERLSARTELPARGVLA